MLRAFDDDRDLIFAAVGELQFEVMQYRLKDEYGVETTLTPLAYQCSAWVVGQIDGFKKPTNAIVVQDRQGRPMALFHSQWDKQYAIKQNPNHELVDVLI
jgi:peptide chain release factor 3